MDTAMLWRYMNANVDTARRMLSMRCERLKIKMEIIAKLASLNLAIMNPENYFTLSHNFVAFADPG